MGRAGLGACCAAVLILLAAGPAPAQPVAERYERIAASPDGIGKRYLGREISQVMGWQGAAWLERAEREQEERTDLLLPELKLAPGMVVAGLNSARPAGWHFDWSRGRLSRRQMERLARLYGAAEPDALHVLVVHHPPAAPPHGTARHLIGRLREFTDAVREAGVDLVLSGHFHMSYAQALLLPGGAAPGSCVMSSVSTAISHRLKGEPNGFHVIDGDDRGLTIADWAWTGETYQERRSWSFESGRGPGNWHPVGSG